jgi:P27 family predicted phage terminase small subunit
MGQGQGGGPKPKPTNVLLMTGSKAAKNRVRPEPIAPGRLTEPPEWLTDAQKETWRYAIENAPLALLRRIDRDLLTAWVMAQHLHRHAAEKIAQFGVLTKAPNTGLPIQSPYLPILNKQALIMIRTAAELGFTPSSRARIALGPADPNPNEGEDPAEEFFRQA